MNTPHIVDVILIGVLAIGVIAGQVKGLIRQVIELLGTVVSFFVAMIFASWLANILALHIGMPYSASLVIAFLLILVLGLIIFHYVALAVQKVVDALEELAGPLVAAEQFEEAAGVYRDYTGPLERETLAQRRQLWEPWDRKAKVADRFCAPPSPWRPFAPDPCTSQRFGRGARVPVSSGNTSRPSERWPRSAVASCAVMSSTARTCISSRSS